MIDESFIKQNMGTWLTEARAGFEKSGRGLLLVAVAVVQDLPVGLLTFWPLADVERCPEMQKCVKPVCDYDPSFEAVVAFTHGGGKTDSCVVVSRRANRSDAGEALN